MASELEQFLDRFLSQVKATLTEREGEYGPPERSFVTLQSFWSQALGQEVTTQQVVLLLTLLKVSRLAWSPDHQDSWVDLAGYAALGAYLRERDQTGSGSSS